MGVMATSRRRSRARPKKTISRSRRKPYAIAASPHALGNPLAISMPPRLLPAQQARVIIENGKWQHRLWTWCVFLSIFSLLLVTLFDLVGPRLWGWTLTPTRMRVLATLDMLSLGVLLLEMGTQFRYAKNKVLFLKHNWFIILALLPLGVLVRALRAFEGLEALRVFQVFGKFGELGVVVPNLDLPFIQPMLAPLAGLVQAISKWTGLGELFELLARILARLSR